MSRALLIVLVFIFALTEISASFNLFRASQNKLHAIRGGLKQRRTNHMSSALKERKAYDGKVDKSFYILTSS